MRLAHFCLLLVIAVALIGCASVNGTKVTPDNSKAVAGIRYSLPKPFILVAPQADDTIKVDVVYLPDSNNTYAIDTSSTMSSYTFQVALDQSGLLSAVEFKQNTSAVGQQAAASAGAAAAQIYNMKAAQVVATQTAVNAAQSSVDSARSACDAAKAQLASDIANNVQASINTDRAALATAQAKLQDAQQVLDRTRNTAQFASITASAGTPITTSPPTPGTTGFGPQTWKPATVYELPQKYGAVLYAVNEGKDAGGGPTVKLNAVRSYFESDGTVKDAPQRDFTTVAYALGPPVLKPQNDKFAVGGKATFNLSQEVISIRHSWVKDAAGNLVKDLTDKTELQKNSNTVVELPLGQLKPGGYILEIQLEYGKTDNFGTATANFSVY
jgi:hypothetical protein